MRNRFPPSLLSLPLLLMTAAPTVLCAQEEEPPREEISVELILTTGVVDREPVDTTEAFAADVGEVYAWMRVTGAEGQTIQIVWTHGAESAPVSLEIGGSSWRTWSSKTVLPEDAGDWTVEVRDADGNVLATANFTVGEAGAISSSSRRRG
jgi:hypothetical protein